MDHATAKTIIEEAAPDLIVGGNTGAHINVRKTERGAPFSIMIPVSTVAVPMDEAEEKAALLAALEAAKSHLG